MQNPPPIVAQDDQHEKDPKGCGWNREEIKCNDVLAMVLEKRPPRLRRWSMLPDHVLRDRCLGDVNTEL